MVPMLDETAEHDPSIPKVVSTCRTSSLSHLAHPERPSGTLNADGFGQELATLTGHTRPVNCVRWASKSQLLASASVCRAPPVSLRACCAVLFVNSHNARVQDDHLALLWTLREADATRRVGNLEQKQVRTATPAKSPVQHSRFSLLCHVDNHAFLYQVENWRLLGRLQGHSHGADSAPCGH
jgi:WD40 repeat protein